MTYKFRKSTPIRTCTKKYTFHGRYKRYLRNDFNCKCGYCDDVDTLGSEPAGYQVDHFAPRKYFPYLATEYSNLVYSCHYCNRAKWNKWPSRLPEQNVVDNEGFIDPCDSQYDTHFQRDVNGRIVFLTDLGKYMYENLQLHLKRHELIWRLSGIQEKRNKLKNKQTSKRKISKKQQALLFKLDESFVDFFEKLQNSCS